LFFSFAGYYPYAPHGPYEYYFYPPTAQQFFYPTDSVIESISEGNDSSAGGASPPTSTSPGSGIPVQHYHLTSIGTAGGAAAAASYGGMHGAGLGHHMAHLIAASGPAGSGSLAGAPGMTFISLPAHGSGHHLPHLAGSPTAFVDAKKKEGMVV
jgi:hypothetical protein